MIKQVNSAFLHLKSPLFPVSPPRLPQGKPPWFPGLRALGPHGARWRRRFGSVSGGGGCQVRPVERRNGGFLGVPPNHPGHDHD